MRQLRAPVFCGVIHRELELAMLDELVAALGWCASRNQVFEAD
jgi:hypothetical protein